MSYAVLTVIYFLYYSVRILSFALMVRAILSWFDPDGKGTACRFVCILTEPLLAVCQKLLDLLSVKNDGPFDLSFFLAVIILWLSQSTLAAAL